MVAYSDWDEPILPGDKASLKLSNPESQPGRWALRPAGGKPQRPEIRISHPDSWFFLKALLPQPFRAMDFRPERLVPSMVDTLPKTPALTDANGRILFLQPADGKMPEEALDWIKEAGLQKLKTSPPSGILAVSRAASARTYFLVQLLDDAAIQALEKTGGVPARPAENALMRLLLVREAVWKRKSEDYLTARGRSPRLCGPGELLGWLSYPDRQLLLRKLNARLGLIGLRSLFYESRADENRKQVPRPDPWTSFPLLLDSLPPEPAATWRWLRFDASAHQTPLPERQRQLWTDWLAHPHLLDGFSQAFSTVWQALVAGPLERRYRDAILQLDAERDITPILRRFGAPFGESFLRNFRHKDLARVFWGRADAWRRVRHLVSKRYENIVNEEIEYLDREVARREPDWAAVYRAKLQWSLAARDSLFAE